MGITQNTPLILPAFDGITFGKYPLQHMVQGFETTLNN